MHGHYSFLVSAMRTAKIIATGFDTMADDFAATMVALRRHRMNRAFKAVEIM
jgi:hypothetical protein